MFPREESKSPTQISICRGVLSFSHHEVVHEYLYNSQKIHTFLLYPSLVFMHKKDRKFGTV